jgi:hypothetical protein
MFETSRLGIIIHDAPLLRTAILSTKDLSAVVLPWGQLTSLTLKRVQPRECVPILQQTSNLVHCKLILFEWWHDEIPDITLPCLESLALKNRPGSGPLLGHLHTFVVPALRSLWVPEPWLQPNPIAALASFISKSGCKLQELHLTQISEPETSYRKAFPLIEKVSLHPVG